MRIWFLRLLLPLLLASGGAGAYAAFGPSDNFLQNLTVDKVKALGARGKLVAMDTSPLNGRMALILIHGVQDQIDPNYFSLHRRRLEISSGGELRKRFKVLEYRYDFTSLPFWLAGKDLVRLIEGDAELTQAGAEVRIIGHSHGGLVGAQALVDEPRKIVQLISLGAPGQGSYLADRAVVTHAINKSGLIELQLLIGKIDWQSYEPLRFTNFDRSLPLPLSGVNNPRLDQLQRELESHRGRISSFAGALPKRSAAWIKKHLDLLEFLAAGYFFRDEGFTNHQMYQIPAILIQQFGVRSDGAVSIGSALSLALRGKQRVLEGYNHREMVDGRDDLYLAELVWQELLRTKGELLGSAFADSLAHLPPLPQIEIFWPQLADADLLLIRNGQLYGADLRLTNLFRLSHLPGEVRFPAVSEQGVLLTWLLQDDTSQVILVKPGGEVEKINGLPSRLATWYRRGEILYQLEEKLVLHQLETGRLHILVEGVKLDLPPLVLGRQIYFLSQKNLYRVDVRSRHQALSQLVPIQSGVFALSSWLGTPVVFVKEADGFQLVFLRPAKSALSLRLMSNESLSAVLGQAGLEIRVNSLRSMRQLIYHAGFLYLALEAQEPLILGLMIGESDAWQTSLLAWGEQLANRFGYTLGVESGGLDLEVEQLSGAYDLVVNLKH